MTSQIEFPFLLVAFLTGARAGSVLLLLAWVIVLFVSILIHELGHAVMGKVYGGEVRILLHGMGWASPTGTAGTSATSRTSW